MDRGAKGLRQKHRDIGHDIPGLIEMIIKFNKKYTPIQVIKTWILHKILDGAYSGAQGAIRKSIKGYGKKESALEAIKRLKKEVLRI